MSIEIRKAKPEESKTLADYVHQVHGDNYEFAKARLDYLIAQNFVIIAIDTENQKIIGRAMFEAIEEPRFGAGMVWGVDILEDYQGKGIGSRILQTLVEEARKYFQQHNTKLRLLYLFTRSTNDIAKTFYKKFGFTEGPKIGKMFLDGEAEEQVMVADFRDK